jgi:hypothetical protein
MSAYRFIHYVLNEVAAGYDVVVRYKCNNRRCIKPEHLELGSRGDNLRDARALHPMAWTTTYYSCL